MPSYDPVTGKRLNGRQQQEKAARNRDARARVAKLAPELAADLSGARFAGDAPPSADPDPISIEPPPDTVAEGVQWAAVLQAMAARHAEQGRDPARVRAVSTVVKAVGSVKAAALDSERAVQVAMSYLSLAVEYLREEPPIEPAALVVWAFHRLLTLAYQTAMRPDEVQEAEVAHRARALQLVATVQPQAAIDELAQRAEEAAAAAAPLRAA